jgi:hypothetical protein
MTESNKNSEMLHLLPKRKTSIDQALREEENNRKAMIKGSMIDYIFQRRQK